MIREKRLQVDLVLDTVGGDTNLRSYAVLVKGGTLVSIVESPNAEKSAEFGVTAKVFLVAPNGAQLAQIAQSIDAGEVTPTVSTTLPLRDAARAHALSESGRTRGKIVLVVR